MNELDVAIEAARAAQAVLAGRRPEAVEQKSGEADLVTEYDRACEAAIRDVFRRHTPDIPVIGEEGGGPRDAAAAWVVDPIDGTTNFVHGFPFYAVSIALQIDGRSQVGVVVDVPRGRTFSAVRGRGASVDGAPLRVSDTSVLSRALVGTGFPYDRADQAAMYLRYVERVLRTTRGIRRAGAASLDLAMVASGCLDAFWEFKLARWDVAAGVLLVEEAGGRVTSVDGTPLHRDVPCPLATNARLHDEFLALLDVRP